MSDEEDEFVEEMEQETESHDGDDDAGEKKDKVISIKLK